MLSDCECVCTGCVFVCVLGVPECVLSGLSVSRRVSVSVRLSVCLCLCVCVFNSQCVRVGDSPQTLSPLPTGRGARGKCKEEGQELLPASPRL